MRGVDGGDYKMKQVGYILSRLCRDRIKRNTVGLHEHLQLSLVDIPWIIPGLPFEVTLVTTKKRNGALSFMQFPHPHPIVNPINWFSLWKVEHKHSTLCIFQVVWHQTSVFLLASCVPELQFAQLPFVRDGCCQKVNTDCGLNSSWLTWWANSKFLLTKR